MAATSRRPPKGKPPAKPQAKKTIKEFPVVFGGYSGAGKVNCGISVRMEKKNCSISTAEMLWCGKRLQVRLFSGDLSQGQKLLWEDAEVQLEAIVDVRRYSSAPEKIGFRLMMVSNEEEGDAIDRDALAELSTKSGMLQVLNVRDPDEQEFAESDESEDAEE